MPLKVKGVRVDGAAAVLGTCNSVKWKCHAFFAVWVMKYRENRLFVNTQPALWYISRF